MNIYLTAIIKCRPECLPEVKTVLENMQLQSRKETTCIQYDLHQGIEDKTLFVFYEIWESKEGLDQHNQQPYIKTFGNMIEEKLEEKPIIYLTQKV